MNSSDIAKINEKSYFPDFQTNPEHPSNGFAQDDEITNPESNHDFVQNCEMEEEEKEYVIHRGNYCYI